MDATGNKVILLSRSEQYIGFRYFLGWVLIKDQREWVSDTTLFSLRSLSELYKNVPKSPE